MKNSLASMVRERVQKEIECRLPELQPVHKAIIPKGWALYATAKAPVVYFVLLVFSKRYEQFTFDVAWSRSGHKPECLPSISLDDVVSDEEFRMRLPLLWRDPHEPEFWWSLEGAGDSHNLESANAKHSSTSVKPKVLMQNRIDDLVVDAVGKIVEHWAAFKKSVP